MQAKQALRFAVTGLCVTAIHVLIAASLIETVLPSPPLANGIAFVLSTFVSYLVNTLWSFSRPLHGKNLLRFACVSLIGLTLAMTISHMAQQMSLHYLLGILAVVCAVPPATFLMHNFWTYR